MPPPAMITRGLEVSASALHSLTSAVEVLSATAPQPRDQRGLEETSLGLVDSAPLLLCETTLLPPAAPSDAPTAAKHVYLLPHPDPEALILIALPQLTMVLKSRD